MRPQPVVQRPPNIKTFGQALRKIRTERGLSHKEVADRVGLKKNSIREWEEDRSTPSNFHLKKLYGTFSSLRFFTTLLPAFEKEKLISKATTIIAAHQGVGSMPEDMWLPPIAGRAEELPEELSRQPKLKTFGDHLRQQRLQDGLDLEDVANLLKVTPQAVGAWELDKANPVMSHYVQLRDLFPKLDRAPTPESPDIPKPDGGKGVSKNLGNNNGTGQRSAPETSTVKKAPLRAVPTAFDAISSTKLQPSKHEEEDEELEIAAPTPSAPKTHAEELAQAGAEYARYLAAKTKDHLRVLTLEVELAGAKKALADTEELIKIAHDRIVELASKQ